MTEVKNILVALDLTNIDDTLINYTSFISELLGAEKVYFVHNIKKYEISELFKEELKDLNLDKIIGDELDEKITSTFKSNTPWEVLISEDPYTESLINYISHKYSIDLAILGNKPSGKGSGVVSSKLLRMLKCDLLSIPPTARPEINNIWIGTDFSKPSQEAFQRGVKLKELTSANINLVHVFNVPVQFTPYLVKEEVAPKIETHVREKAAKFLKKLNYKKESDLKIYPGRDASVGEKLLVEAKRDKADMIILSDKGSNAVSALMVGSVTDEVFNQELPAPLWITK
ncbi:MAG: universal stress protein [Salegentibacter sp.]|uniref:Nucleotide-binding universal stress protein, UspA family n=1 Tax=Salegentibacter flavus TaxID=287099 RepID=A0A1I5C5E4_9FLAO|nr:MULTISPECIES: universal stress protein [Salegentibacter]MDR9457334.1 universal stress protein [Salegentibacter sp.]SFN82022.1 Nucleotide-binding universal stress protein, UspA family [Salegentibacter flavus]